MTSRPPIEVLSPTSPIGRTEYLKSTKDLRAHLKNTRRYHKDICEWKALLGQRGFQKFSVIIPADINPSTVTSTIQKIRDEKIAEIQRVNAGLARLRAANLGGSIEMSAGMVSRLTNDFNKHVNETVKIVSGMRKRTRKDSKQRAGFSIPQQYNQEIVTFFRTAASQGLMPTCNGQTMQELALNFFAGGIASQNMMRNMLMVYAYNAAKPQLVHYATENGGRIGANGAPIPDTSRPKSALKRNFLGVDLFMLNNLPEALKTAVNKFNVPKAGARSVGRNKATGLLQYRAKDVHKRFNVNNFKLGSLQSIGAAVKVANSNLSTMNEQEKEFYREFVLRPERIIKDINEDLKKAARKNKTSYVPQLIPYDQYRVAMAQRAGGQLSEAVERQLSVDKEDQNLTHFRNCLKAVV
uniref:Uncharacterized protein n=1 Tax=Pithovirus LCPAC201 TaxID=2506591 RepID=A0A481Z5E9_9VIRU|nr:MAG: hypothetical protein LCPAC201_00660 [Pithovirus LCPAC201]